MDNRKQAVLEVAKNGDFENVKPLEHKWNGLDVWAPCGPNEETLYIGAVCFVDDGETVTPHILDDAKKIYREMNEQAGIFPSDFCD